MPRLRSPRIPKYRLHKASGQAIVTLDGRDIYLGEHNSEASRQRYERAVGEWLANGRSLPLRATDDDPLTVDELLAGFWRHAEIHYRSPNGTPTSELDSFVQAFKPLRKLYGDSPAKDFGPLALRAVREVMIRDRWSRGYINRQISRIKLVFRWGVEREMIPSNISHALDAMPGLKRGRTEAHESEPVRPVPRAYVDAVLPHVSRQVAAMIELQWQSGARSGEIVMMRLQDIETTGKIWTYRPATHKTAHHGHERVIYLNDKAQSIIREFMTGRPLTAYLFSPAEAEFERQEERRANRKSPMTPSQRLRAERAQRRWRQRPPAERYDVDSYRRAIARACEIAFPLPDSLAQREDESNRQWKARLTPEQLGQVRQWNAEHSWHPHQLRHSFATLMRKRHGLELTRILCGHKSAAITEVYAEADFERAKEVMAQAV